MTFRKSSVRKKTQRQSSSSKSRPRKKNASSKSLRPGTHRRVEHKTGSRQVVPAVRKVVRKEDLRAAVPNLKRQASRDQN
jgi:hypothetical protein